MDEVLRAALEPVLEDLRRAGLTQPRVEARHWTGRRDRPSAMVWSPDGSGQGVSVDRSASGWERVAAAADQVQEWVIEERWAGHATTNWPPCPHHPDTHPLQAATHERTAVWACPADGTVVAPVGRL